MAHSNHTDKLGLGTYIPTDSPKMEDFNKNYNILERAFADLLRKVKTVEDSDKNQQSIITNISNSITDKIDQAIMDKLSENDVVSNETLERIKTELKKELSSSNDAIDEYKKKLEALESTLKVKNARVEDRTLILTLKDETELSFSAPNDIGVATAEIAGKVSLNEIDNMINTVITTLRLDNSRELWTRDDINNLIDTKFNKTGDDDTKQILSPNAIKALINSIVDQLPKYSKATDQTLGLITLNDIIAEVNKKKLTQDELANVTANIADPLTTLNLKSAIDDLVDDKINENNQSLGQGEGKKVWSEEEIKGIAKSTEVVNHIKTNIPVINDDNATESGLTTPEYINNKITSAIDTFKTKVNESIETAKNTITSNLPTSITDNNPDTAGLTTINKIKELINNKFDTIVIPEVPNSEDEIAGIISKNAIRELINSDSPELTATEIIDALKKSPNLLVTLGLEDPVKGVLRNNLASMITPDMIGTPSDETSKGVWSKEDLKNLLDNSNTLEELANKLSANEISASTNTSGIRNLNTTVNELKEKDKTIETRLTTVESTNTRQDERLTALEGLTGGSNTNLKDVSDKLNALFTKLNVDDTLFNNKDLKDVLHDMIVDDSQGWIADKGLITSTDLDSKIEEVKQDVDNTYAKKSELPDLSPYATKSEVSTLETKVDTKITQDQGDARYARISGMDIYALKTEIPTIDYDQWASKATLNEVLSNLNNKVDRSVADSIYIPMTEKDTYAKKDKLDEVVEKNKTLETTLNKKANQSDLNNLSNTVATKVTLAELENVFVKPSSLNDFATKNDLATLPVIGRVDALETEMANKLNKSEAEEKYATKNSVTTALNNYALKSELPTDYVTNTSFSSTVNTINDKVNKIPEIEKKIEGIESIETRLETLENTTTTSVALENVDKRIKALDTKVEGLATDKVDRSDMDNYYDKSTADSTFIKSTELNNLVTTASLSNTLEPINTKLDKKMNTEDADNKYATKENLNQYATITQLNDKASNSTVEEIRTSLSNKVDNSELTKLAKTTDLDSYYNKEQSDERYTKKSEMSAYATTDMIPSITNLATKDSVAELSTEVSKKVSLGDIENTFVKPSELTNYARVDQLPDVSSLADKASTSDLESLRSEVNTKVTLSQVDETYAKKTDLTSLVKASDLDTRISANSDVTNLKEAIETKASAEEVETLKRGIPNLATKAQLEAANQSISGVIENLRNNYVKKNQLPDLTPYATKVALGEVSGKVDTLSTKVEAKVDKEYSEATYAKKTDLSDYITLGNLDTNLKSNQYISSINSIANNAVTKAYVDEIKVYTLSEVDSKINTAKENVKEEINETIESTATTLRGELASEKKTLEDSVNALKEELKQTNSRITDSKSDSELDLEKLKQNDTKQTSDIAAINQKLDNLDLSAIEGDHTNLNDLITNLKSEITSKANTAKSESIQESKSYADGIKTSAVNDSKAYTDEKVRTDIDTAKQELTRTINAVSSDLSATKDTVSGHTTSISALENRLTQHIDSYNTEKPDKNDILRRLTSLESEDNSTDTEIAGIKQQLSTLQASSTGDMSKALEKLNEITAETKTIKSTIATNKDDIESKLDEHKKAIVRDYVTKAVADNTYLPKTALTLSADQQRSLVSLIAINPADTISTLSQTLESEKDKIGSNTNALNSLQGTVNGLDTKYDAKYLTKTDAESTYAKINTLNNYVLTSALDNYSTTENVTTKITEALQPYATTESVANTYVTNETYTNGIARFITADALSPYLTVAAAETTYLKKIDLSKEIAKMNLAKTSDLTNLVDRDTLNSSIANFVTNDNLISKGYLTADNISHLATSTQLQALDQKYTGELGKYTTTEGLIPYLERNNFRPNLDGTYVKANELTTKLNEYWNPKETSINSRLSNLEKSNGTLTAAKLKADTIIDDLLAVREAEIQAGNQDFTFTEGLITKRQLDTAIKNANATSASKASELVNSAITASESKQASLYVAKDQANNLITTVATPLVRNLIETDETTKNNLWSAIETKADNKYIKSSELFSAKAQDKGTLTTWFKTTLDELYLPKANVTTTVNDLIATAIADKADRSDLSNYVTTTSMTDYHTKGEITTLLNDYLTTNTADSKYAPISSLNNYVTTTTLSNYLTKSDANSKYLIKAEFDTVASTNGYNKSEAIYREVDRRISIATASFITNTAARAYTDEAIRGEVSRADGVYAKKTDLNNLVTTESLNRELESKATKDDLNNYVSNETIKNYHTKSDVTGLLTPITSKQGELERSIQGLNTSINQANSNISGLTPKVTALESKFNEAPLKSLIDYNTEKLGENSSYNLADELKSFVTGTKVDEKIQVAKSEVTGLIPDISTLERRIDQLPTTNYVTSEIGKIINSDALANKINALTSDFVTNTALEHKNYATKAMLNNYALAENVTLSKDEQTALSSLLNSTNNGEDLTSLDSRTSSLEADNTINKRDVSALKESIKTKLDQTGVNSIIDPKISGLRSEINAKANASQLNNYVLTTTFNGLSGKVSTNETAISQIQNDLRSIPRDTATMTEFKNYLDKFNKVWKNTQNDLLERYDGSDHIIPLFIKSGANARYMEALTGGSVTFVNKLVEDRAMSTAWLHQLNRNNQSDFWSTFANYIGLPALETKLGQRIDAINQYSDDKVDARINSAKTSLVAKSELNNLVTTAGFATTTNVASAVDTAKGELNSKITSNTGEISGIKEKLKTVVTDNTNAINSLINEGIRTQVNPSIESLTRTTNSTIDEFKRTVETRLNSVSNYGDTDVSRFLQTNSYINESFLNENAYGYIESDERFDARLDSVKNDAVAALRTTLESDITKVIASSDISARTDSDNRPGSISKAELIKVINRKVVTYNPLDKTENNLTTNGIVSKDVIKHFANSAVHSADISGPSVGDNTVGTISKTAIKTLIRSNIPTATDIIAGIVDKNKIDGWINQYISGNKTAINNTLGFTDNNINSKVNTGISTYLSNNYPGLVNTPTTNDQRGMFTKTDIQNIAKAHIEGEILNKRLNTPFISFEDFPYAISGIAINGHYDSPQDAEYRKHILDRSHNGDLSTIPAGDTVVKIADSFGTTYIAGVKTRKQETAGTANWESNNFDYGFLPPKSEYVQMYNDIKNLKAGGGNSELRSEIDALKTGFSNTVTTKKSIVSYGDIISAVNHNFNLSGSPLNTLKNSLTHPVINNNSNASNNGIISKSAVLDIVNRGLTKTNNSTEGPGLISKSDVQTIARGVIPSAITATGNKSTQGVVSVATIETIIDRKISHEGSTKDGARSTLDFLMRL